MSKLEKGTVEDSYPNRAGEIVWVIKWENGIRSTITGAETRGEDFDTGERVKFRDGILSRR